MRASFFRSLFARLLLVSTTIGSLATVASAVADKRFDITTFNCTPEGSPDHFCEPQFDSLNWKTTNGHFLAMGTDNRRADVNGQGNFLAAYYNDLTGLYGSTTGAQAADQIEQYVLTNFTNTGVKTKWVILNEISAGLWPDSADYRAWLRTLVARLNNVYLHEVILFSPFGNPGANGADWVPLSNNCYIAIEKYLSGAAINASGNSVEWCRQQYQASKNAYIALGVASSRLYLAEHFGQTVAGTAWGRSGVSATGWHNAIRARADAAKIVGFTGFVGYAWGKNGMGVPEVEMVSFQETYKSKVLP
ncbi:MAG: hypothetical protein M3478_07615 [Planctomycetota bacterium]|nr:hypothetical protein [Planctomycetota bacterium]